MPIRPPDQVITHRIEMGRREREMLESVIASYSFNKVATPVVAGMSDVSFMVVLAGLVSALFPNIVIPTGIDTMDELVDALVSGYKQARANNPDDTFDISNRDFIQYLFEEGTLLGRIFT
jgi:hypothetical protein